MAEDKGIFYNNRVLLGNWYESTTLEEIFTHNSLVMPRNYLETLCKLPRIKYDIRICSLRIGKISKYKLKKFLKQMERGEIMLAKFRKMTENLRLPTVLTQSSKSVRFGARIALLAPHVPASDSPIEDSKGLLLGGRISSDEINYIQDLEDGCSVVCAAEEVPAEMNTFIITSSDYCKRDGDSLKYNQEFLMALSSSVARNKPLYLRYDPNAIPGLCGKYPLYLSRHPVTSTRWRALPVHTPEITRFEMEGQPVPVNKDVIINHCATNVNLGINIGCWTMGFYGKVCCPLMKTCLDVYGRETAHNIWQIYTPIADDEKKE